MIVVTALMAPTGRFEREDRQPVRRYGRRHHWALALAMVGAACIALAVSFPWGWIAMIPAIGCSIMARRLALAEPMGW
jgi:hypothetical protein